MDFKNVHHSVSVRCQYQLEIGQYLGQDRQLANIENTNIPKQISH